MKNLLSKIFKRQSEIIDVQKRKLSDYDLLYFNSLIEVVFTVKGIDGRIYKVKGKTNNLLGYKINVYFNSSKSLEDIQAHGQLNPELSSIDYQRIDNQNPKYVHFGFGAIMMQLFLELINYYEEVNNVKFDRITGTIGNGAEDDPDKSIPFYAKFDNYSFGNSLLELNRNGFNKIDRNLEYLIKRK